LSCFVCDKHRDVDSVLAEDHMVVAHLPLTTPAGTAETAYLGHLIVEPRRASTGGRASTSGRTRRAAARPRSRAHAASAWAALTARAPATSDSSFA
jgi:hypothetical protein